MTVRITIVGRPNAGKSTLFNRLVGINKAIVEDVPGVTRDRIHGKFIRNNRSFEVIDTGGVEFDESDNPLAGKVLEQIMEGIRQGSLVVFLLDAKTGPTPFDFELNKILKKTKKKVYYVVNKCDNEELKNSAYSFYELGMDELFFISAVHKTGIEELLDRIAEDFKEEEIDEEVEERGIKICVIGRPNVGKSTLINKLLNQNRVIVSDMMGTTRDSIDIETYRGGKKYVFVDTPGIRRKRSIDTRLEGVSVYMSIKTIEKADIALFLIDATEGVTHQDAQVASLLERYHTASIIVYNKWDLLDEEVRKKSGKIEKEIYDRLKFLRYSPIVFASALNGKNVHKLWTLIDEIYEEYTKRIPTAKINQFFDKYIKYKQPPMYKTKIVKIYYITQVKTAPPYFVAFTNYPEAIHFSYKRYLLNRIRKDFGFKGVPINLKFKKKS